MKLKRHKCLHHHLLMCNLRNQLSSNYILISRTRHIDAVAIGNQHMIHTVLAPVHPTPDQLELGVVLRVVGEIPLLPSFFYLISKVASGGRQSSRASELLALSSKLFSQHLYLFLDMLLWNIRKGHIHTSYQWRIGLSCNLLNKRANVRSQLGRLLYYGVNQKKSISQSNLLEVAPFIHIALILHRRGFSLSFLI